MAIIGWILMGFLLFMACVAVIRHGKAQQSEFRIPKRYLKGSTEMPGTFQNRIDRRRKRNKQARKSRKINRRKSH